MMEVKWSPELVDEFGKRWGEFWQWVDSAGVPVPLREAALRDMLAGIEGLRTANALVNYIPMLRGRQQ